MLVVGWQDNVGADRKGVERNCESISRNVGEPEHRAFNLLLERAVAILVLIHNHALT